MGAQCSTSPKKVAHLFTFKYKATPLSPLGNAAPFIRNVFLASPAPMASGSTHETQFDPFYTTKDPDKGVGLGLSVSQGIIRSMGGEIEASNHGDGARIFISLPVVVDNLSEQA